MKSVISNFICHEITCTKLLLFFDIVTLVCWRGEKKLFTNIGKSLICPIDALMFYVGT